MAEIGASMSDEPVLFEVPDDAWVLLDELDGLLRGLYGPPNYQHIDMF